MKMNFIFPLSLAVLLLFSACRPSAPNQAGPGALKVLVVESFLADITRNVAGERAAVDTLMPRGVDPHAYEPTPQDVARIAESSVFIINGGGIEEWLDEVIANAGGQRLLIEASRGLQSRVRGAGERVEEEHAGEGDPHFWLDPLLVIQYVENIRDGLTQADPQGKAIYAANADAYIARLKDLDQEIQAQVAAIPEERRLLVTDHESFGYFADRYGFRIIGTIVPGVSSGASPSAQELARLVDAIQANHVTAIFLQAGANPQLAEQVAKETGARVVTNLYTHSTGEGGAAPTYIEMMKYNTETIVSALK